MVTSMYKGSSHKVNNLVLSVELPDKMYYAMHADCIQYWHSSISFVARLLADIQDLNTSIGRVFSSLKCPDRLWGPFSLLFNGQQDSFLGVQWLWCDVNHSPISKC
jgi:hypothetical protein